MMNRSVSIFSKVTVAIAMAATFAACKQGATDTKATATPVAATPDKADVVYLNGDSLLAKLDYAKDMNARLQDKGKAAQADVSSKKEAFQREVGEYQKGANAMSAEQRAPIEQRLQRKGQEIQAYEQNATAQFQNEQASESEKLYAKIADATKAYAKEKGYKFVLSTTRANTTIWYGDASLDVTAAIAKSMNDDYAKTKK